MKTLLFVLYALTFNAAIQGASLLFSLFAGMTHSLFLSVVLLSLAVSCLSSLIARGVARRLNQRGPYGRYAQHRQLISRNFSGRVKLIYLLGLIKVFRHGLLYEFIRNLSLLFKVFLFIPAYIFLSHELQLDLRGLSTAFIFHIDPFSACGVWHGIRLLPVLMLLLSVLSGLIYYEEAKADISKHVFVSLLFLLLLYNSKAILVVYWCFNIFFSALLSWLGRTRCRAAAEVRPGTSLA